MGGGLGIIGTTTAVGAVGGSYAGGWLEGSVDDMADDWFLDCIDQFPNDDNDGDGEPDGPVVDVDPEIEEGTTDSGGCLQCTGYATEIHDAGSEYDESDGSVTVYGQEITVCNAWVYNAFGVDDNGDGFCD